MGGVAGTIGVLTPIFVELIGVKVYRVWSYGDAYVVDVYGL